MALSLLLLAGAGLFFRTLMSLQHQELGFDKKNLLLFTVDGRYDGYSGERLATLYTEIGQKIRAVPGVLSASSSSFAFSSGWGYDGPITTQGGAIHSGKAEDVYNTGVGPDLIATMHMKLLLGREIGQRDVEGRRRVAVVNETFARHYYGASDPIGRRFNFGDAPDPANEFEIVGVVEDAKDEGLREKPMPSVYSPFTAGGIAGLGSLTFEVRTAREPEALVAAVREAVHRVDPRLPLIHVTTQSVTLDEQLQREHSLTVLSSTLGGLALLLASIGLYGNVAYAVTRRTSEIGIRMALGANRKDVLWMSIRESLIPIAIGIGAGVPLTLAAGRSIQTMLYGVRFFSPVILGGSILVLIGVAVLAALVPARRATRIDPLAALRHE